MVWLWATSHSTDRRARSWRSGIGYSVVPAWRRRGVASRACALILQQAWQDGADTVVAETDADNVASQAVLLRNGFQRRPDGVFMINRPEAR